MAILTTAILCVCSSKGSTPSTPNPTPIQCPQRPSALRSVTRQVQIKRQKHSLHKTTPECFSHYAERTVVFCVCIMQKWLDSLHHAIMTPVMQEIFLFQKNTPERFWHRNYSVWGQRLLCMWKNPLFLPRNASEKHSGVWLFWHNLTCRTIRCFNLM